MEHLLDPDCPEDPHCIHCGLYPKNWEAYPCTHEERMKWWYIKERAHLDTPEVRAIVPIQYYTSLERD